MTSRNGRASARPLLPLVFLAVALGAASSAAAGRWGADYFPNVELTTQDGQKVRFYDDLLKDKLVALNVIYT